MSYYPIIDPQTLWSLQIILRNLAEDPDYLIESPYSDDEIEVLNSLMGIVNLDVGDSTDDEDEEAGDKWSVLEKQTQKLYKSLLEEQNNLNVKDNAEKMSFFRTATSLLDKLVNIQERAANLARIHYFHNTVLRIMDDVLDAGQRTAVMEQLKKAIEE